MYRHHIDYDGYAEEQDLEYEVDTYNFDENPLESELIKREEEDEQHEAVRRIWGNLPSPEKEIIGWTFGMDGETKTNQQIARSLGMSIEEVEERYFKGMALLKIGLEPYVQ